MIEVLKQAYLNQHFMGLKVALLGHGYKNEFT
jgi:hypothetical protein